MGTQCDTDSPHPTQSDSGPDVTYGCLTHLMVKFACTLHTWHTHTHKTTDGCDIAKIIIEIFVRHYANIQIHTLSYKITLKLDIFKNVILQNMIVFFSTFS